MVLLNCQVSRSPFPFGLERVHVDDDPAARIFALAGQMSATLRRDAEVLDVLAKAKLLGGITQNIGFDVDEALLVKFFGDDRAVDCS